MQTVPRRGPHPAAPVDPEPVRHAMRRGPEQPAVRQRGVRRDIEGLDLVLLPAERFRRVRDVQRAPVGREGEPVRLLEIRHSGQRSAGREVAIDAAMIQFRLRQAALPRDAQTEHRIGEPECAVGRDGEVIGRVEPVAPIMGDERSGLILGGRSADAAPAMFAVHQIAVRIQRVAVHEERAVDHDLDMAILVPGQQPAVLHVGPCEAPVRGNPDRTLAVDGPVVQNQQFRIPRHDAGKTLVRDLHPGEWPHLARRPRPANQTPHFDRSGRHGALLPRHASASRARNGPLRRRDSDATPPCRFPPPAVPMPRPGACAPAPC